MTSEWWTAEAINRAMPFIRYDMGDVGIWRTDPCVCGRSTRTLESVEGRAEDYVVTPEGNRILWFDYVFKDADRVREAQVLQHEPGGIVVRVVRARDYGERYGTLIRDAVRNKVSPRLRVAFEYVE